MIYKNYPMVSRVVFGRGSFNQLDEILAPKRKGRNAPFIFYVDDVFKGNHWLTSRITLSYRDKIIYVPTNEEPKTSQIDQLVEDIDGWLSLAGRQTILNERPSEKTLNGQGRFARRDHCWEI